MNPWQNYTMLNGRDENGYVCQFLYVTDDYGDLVTVPARLAVQLGNTGFVPK